MCAGGDLPLTSPSVLCASVSAAPIQLSNICSRQTNNTFCLQTKAGRTPEGHCCHEFQEYLRLVVIPKCQLLAFKFSHGKVSACYNRLKSDLDWCEEDGPCFMLALDKDRRHSMSDMQHWRFTKNGTGTGELRDRRELDKTVQGWIALTKKQIVPAAPKQCDTIQAPVEMVMSQLKREARKVLPPVGQRDGMMLCKAVVKAAKGLTAENVWAYWEHAKKAIQVWSSLGGEMHEIWLSRNNYTEPYYFKGTHGGLVPKLLRG